MDIFEAREKCEEAIVSYGFVSPAVFMEVSNLVTAVDFHDKDMRTLFTLLVERADAVKASDINAIAIEMRDRGLALALGTGISSVTLFVHKLLDKGYSANNGRYYAEQLRKINRRETVRNAAATLNDGLLDPTTDLSEAMSKFEYATQLAYEEGPKVVKLADAAREAVGLQREAKKSGKKLGMSTGFRDLDLACGGFFKGQLILLSARSYFGKTALAMNLATNLATGGFVTSVHCLEMKCYELAERTIGAFGGPELAQFAQCDLDDIDFANAEKAIRDLEQIPVYLNEATSETVATIRGKAKYQKAKYGLDVLVVDHLQRLRKTDPRQEMRHHLKDSCNALKNLARELDCAVLLLSQLKIEEDGKEPDDTSYSESKQVFEEADLAMLLNRPSKSSEEATLRLNKVRKGQETHVQLRFNGSRQRFEDCRPTGTPFNPDAMIGGYLGETH